MRYSRTTESSTEMDRYVTTILVAQQKGKCSGCDARLKDGFHIHHKRYGEDIKISDLVLVCLACHGKEHSKVRVGGHARHIE